MPRLLEDAVVLLMLGPGQSEIEAGSPMANQGLWERIGDGANQGGSVRHRIEWYPGGQEPMQAWAKSVIEK